MQAEGIKAGDRYDNRDGEGRIIGGWTATGDAVVEHTAEYGRPMVFVPVKHHDGGEGVRVWTPGQQVPISFGKG